MPADKRATETQGFLYGIAAYSLWGLFPLYWKRLVSVNSTQILMHRVLWAFFFMLVMAFILGKRQVLRAAMRDPLRFWGTGAAGFLITANWGVYIYAVNSGHIVETSLGYYLNPLVSVALGALILRERMDKGMMFACGIASIGIGILAISYGKLPWVSLTLAFSFALYGLVKKLLDIDAVASLTLETAFVLPFAAAYLIFEETRGRGSFTHGSYLETALLMCAGAVTAIPLFFYSEGVKRISLSKMGILQYISPTIQLALGIFVYGERLSGIRAAAFACIVSALLVFALSRFKKKNILP